MSFDEWDASEVDFSELFSPKTKSSPDDANQKTTMDVGQLSKPKPLGDHHAMRQLQVVNDGNHAVLPGRVLIWPIISRIIVEKNDE